MFIFISVFVRRLGRLKRTRRASETHILIVCLRCIRTYDTLIFAHYHHAYTQQQQKKRKVMILLYIRFCFVGGLDDCNLYYTGSSTIDDMRAKLTHIFVLSEHTILSFTPFTYYHHSQKRKSGHLKHTHTHIHTHTHSLTR